MTQPDDNLKHDPLAARLKGLYPTPPIPGEVERDILAMPGRHLATQRRKRNLRWAMWGSTGAVAAGLLLTFMLMRGGGEQRPVPSVARDIGDAFYLARQIKAGHADPAWDRNHDGVVDQKDVDALGQEAVRL